MGKASPDQRTERLDDDLPSGPGRPPGAQQRYRLVVASGQAKGKTVGLRNTPGDETHIGKEDDNDLTLPDTTVSRFHCVVVRDDKGWLLRDLGSTNGTFVDEARAKEIYLRPGMVVRVGSVSVRVVAELAPLRLEPASRESFGPLLGRSVRMREIFALLERVLDSEAPVVIEGETGTGKGAAARAIHEQSRNASGPFVVVDCAAVAPNLIESELFGHERGAFTGAEIRRVGALEGAHGGTLFLDEIDDLRKDLQPKLLRALEDKAFQRLGSNQTQRFSARVLAASKRNFRSLVGEGRLREDLYFRLAVFRVELPPLREHTEDLPLLVDKFAAQLGASETWSRLPETVRARLAAHRWPGNIRELRNAVERAFALAGGPPLREQAWDLEADGFDGSEPSPNLFESRFKDAKEQVLDRFEREYLVRLLQRHAGNVSRSARAAGLNRGHLHTLLEKHGLVAHASAADEDPSSHE